MPVVGLCLWGTHRAVSGVRDCCPLNPATDVAAVCRGIKTNQYSSLIGTLHLKNPETRKDA